MIRTQIQLPNDIHVAAKALAAQQERSLAEIVRRALEEHLAQYPNVGKGEEEEWQLPVLKTGGFVEKNMTHERLKQIMDDDLDYYHMHKMYPDQYPYEDEA